MNSILIKNGKVLIFRDNDVITEKKDVLIDNGKIRNYKELDQVLNNYRKEN